ncbi:hypothetical protein [Tessaracoccus palaemonis]|uniref:Uncharacterized protein n=1 Tax=Tessaracoccus palaemonis TaxID=2829499 RepID=A0ABX8SEC2_9ACTN|nr:hypothetical protein [Tessaracoccus palaemonis]QXT61640.1 hypothetical protein KDB89_07405 [Tessaracoccus palaemonis]
MIAIGAPEASVEVCKVGRIATCRASGRGSGAVLVDYLLEPTALNATTLGSDTSTVTRPPVGEYREGAYSPAMFSPTAHGTTSDPSGVSPWVIVIVVDSTVSVKHVVSIEMLSSE